MCKRDCGTHRSRRPVTRYLTIRLRRLRAGNRKTHRRLMSQLFNCVHPSFLLCPCPETFEQLPSFSDRCRVFFTSYFLRFSSSPILHSPHVVAGIPRKSNSSRLQLLLVQQICRLHRKASCHSFLSFILPLVIFFFVSFSHPLF